MSAFDDTLGLIDSTMGAAPPVNVPQQQRPSPQTDIDRVLSTIDSVASEPRQQSGFTLAQPGQESKVNPATGFGQGVIDALSAGAQGTSPVVAGIGGKGNYQLAPQSEQAFFSETGEPRDQTKFVALRDPGTGQYAVYHRNPEMNESAPTSLGRLLTYSQPETGIPSVATSAAPNASQNLLQDFTKAGVSPSIPAVGQGIGSRLTANIMSKLPFVGGPVAAASGKAVGETGQAAERLAGLYGSASNAEEGGQALQSGIPAFAQQFKNKASALYDSFWNSIDQTKQVPITNTLDALQGPMQRFPTSPELGSAITSPKLQQLYQAASAGGGNLTLGELKEFRSSIGNLISDPMLINDTPRADLKGVYGSITQDIEDALRAQGQQNQSVALPSGMKPTDPLAAWQRANAFYKAGMSRVDQLEPLLKGSPEQSLAAINRAASTGPAANAGLLQTIQKSIPDEQWGDVGSAVIRQLGKPTAGAKDISHGDFSASSFVTNWNKLSDSAKDTLFGAETPGSNREALEALTRVSNAQKNVSKFANPSGTASHALPAMGAGLVAEHFLDLTSHPLETAAGLLTGYGISKALMAPWFAKWLYGMPNTVAQAPTPMVGVQRSLSTLDQLSRLNPQLAPIAQTLHSQLNVPY